VVHQSVLFRLALYFILVSGFVLAALSLVLRRDKTLGTAAMVVTLLGTMIGSLPAPSRHPARRHLLRHRLLRPQRTVHRVSVHPIERLFAQSRTQGIFREEWREDLFYYLVSSLLFRSSPT